jgi:hypothetical protein
MGARSKVVPNVQANTLQTIIRRNVEGEGAMDAEALFCHLRDLNPKTG